MEPAGKRLAEIIYQTKFNTPVCPVYQKVTARAETDAVTIQQNLVARLTAPVRWTQSINQMIAVGATEFVEVGPGNVLQGLIKKMRG